MSKRSIKIEKRYPGHYEVIKYRNDGVGSSVGWSKTKTGARKLKKKNAWS
jgi:hypothetical protein